MVAGDQGIVVGVTVAGAGDKGARVGSGDRVGADGEKLGSEDEKAGCGEGLHCWMCWSVGLACG